MQHGPQGLQNRFLGNTVELQFDGEAFRDIGMDIDLLVTEQRYPDHGHPAVDSLYCTHQSAMGQEHFHVWVACKTTQP